MESGKTDVASHVHGKVNISTGICYGSRDEDIRSLWFLLGVAGDGMCIEEDLKDERLWLCFPCVDNNTVSELDQEMGGDDNKGRIYASE
jgi:hypothetical protein